MKAIIRVMEILQNKGIKPIKAEKDLSLSNGYLATMLKREGSLGEDILIKLSEYLDYSLDYLVRGKENTFLNNMLSEPETEYNTKNSGIPMYDIPASATNVEMYGDANDGRVIGYLNIPGAVKNSFALPVHGHSMYPTLENGSWCVLRPISDVQDIEWGEIYYIEYGDYRLFKRLLQSDELDSVILWSDNQSETILNRPKYAAKTIKKERLKRLCLLTDILKKPNY